MTNGEKMLNVFCDSKALELGGNVSFRDGDWAIMFPDEWWHTEYKEPTTKNDLGVDCISRKAALDITWHDPSYSDPLNVLTEVRDKIRELPSVTPQLSVPEVTALAEWIEKLTKECEEAYNKGYADGVKSVNICPHCGEYIGEEE